MTPPIRTERLTKVYRAGSAAVRAIADVDIIVQPGELVLLMGPSGSGKSTLLSMIGCILRPTSGRVLLNGREVGNLRDRELARIRLREIGFIFQEANLFPSLNASENVEMPLELLGIRGGKARRRSAALLESVGLLARASASPRDLSGGERQRVAIARALAAGAGILLADEPTAALDLASGRNVFGHLRRLAVEERKAVVAVSHDHRMHDFATRTVYLEDGRLASEPAAQLTGGAV